MTLTSATCTSSTESPASSTGRSLQRHQGIRDLAYFVVLSLDTEVRRTHERDLVRLYQETLRDCAVSDEDIDPEQAWEHYRSFSL